MTKKEQVELLVLEEFRTVPFHNLFMLNNIVRPPSTCGGTCSDKALHFINILKNNNITARLHSAFINGKECHRMIFVELDGQGYFIDIGSGWPSIKLLPLSEEVEYSVFGMTFRTEILKDTMVLHHRTKDFFKPMVSIPLALKDEDKILEEIGKRYDDVSIYPFQNSLRFSKVIGDAFYFIKGEQLRIYNAEKYTEVQLAKAEIKKILKEIFLFDFYTLDF